MTATSIDIQANQFFINGALTYSEIEGSNSTAHGLLMNARFIQGIFDDRAEPHRFARFGHNAWDPEANTDRLIAALPDCENASFDVAQDVCWGGDRTTRPRLDSARKITYSQISRVHSRLVLQRSVPPLWPGSYRAARRHIRPKDA